MAKKKEATSGKSPMNSVRWEFHQAQGGLNYCLEVFGDSLRTTHGWKNELDGLEAIRYYLMTKHHWTPAVLRAMSLEDLRFALTEEMQGWTLPKDAGGRSNK